MFVYRNNWLVLRGLACTNTAHMRNSSYNLSWIVNEENSSFKSSLNVVYLG